VFSVTLAGAGYTFNVVSALTFVGKLNAAGKKDTKSANTIKIDNALDLFLPLFKNRLSNIPSTPSYKNIFSRGGIDIWISQRNMQQSENAVTPTPLPPMVVKLTAKEHAQRHLICDLSFNQ
jgi:hypothetical protein